MNIKCDQRTPTEEGYYIWIPEYTKGPEMIRVYMEPEVSKYGLVWEPYLAVAGMRGRSVEHLQGTFSKKLSFSN